MVKERDLPEEVTVKQRSDWPAVRRSGEEHSGQREQKMPSCGRGTVDK